MCHVTGWTAGRGNADAAPAPPLLRHQRGAPTAETPASHTTLCYATRVLGRCRWIGQVPIDRIVVLCYACARQCAVCSCNAVGGTVRG
eukprot:12447-Rhodomonas_salina.4